MKLTLAPILAVVVGLSAVPVQAEMVLSQVIVDLFPGQPGRGDIEVFNDGDERMYVLAEAFQILNPGTPSEERVPAMPPDEAGLLVSPQRLVLAPGERRTIRIAALGERSLSDRVYRVAIRPVAGAIEADANALKLFVGYDTLIIVRPDNPTDTLAISRERGTVSIRNDGNTSQEIFEGQQCDADGRNCRSLPAKRLYPGATWELTLPYDTKARYLTAIGPQTRKLEF